MDVYPEKKEPIDVVYDVDKINALLGIDVSEDEMCKYWEMVELVRIRQRNVFMFQLGVRIFCVLPIWQRK